MILAVQVAPVVFCPQDCVFRGQVVLSVLQEDPVVPERSGPVVPREVAEGQAGWVAEACPLG